MKDNNNMIISTDTEKAFDKHPIIRKSQTRHKVPQHNKGHIKSQSIIMPNGKKN